MHAGGHAARGLLGGKARADRKAAAERLGRGHDVGRDAGMLMGEQPTRPPHAALDLVKDQKQALVVAKGAQVAQGLPGHRPEAALALDGLDQDGGRLVRDGRLEGIHVAERHLFETGRPGAEPFQIFGLAAGGDRGDRPAMEGALEGDDADALGLASGVEMAARGLDRALDRLGARIGEEDPVGEGRRAQALGETRLSRNLVEVRGVPQPAGLRGQRRDQVRMGVAERVDGDAAAEIEIGLAGGVIEPGALAAVGGKGGASIGVEQGRPHRHGPFPSSRVPFVTRRRVGVPPNKNAAQNERPLFLSGGGAIRQLRGQSGRREPPRRKGLPGSGPNWG